MNLSEIMTSITDHLCGWRVDKINKYHFSRIAIISDKGKKIIVEVHGQKLKFHAVWPHCFGYNQIKPNNIDVESIGISYNRTPKSIAKDLNKRLIAPYLEYYDKSLEMKNDILNRRLKTKNIIDVFNKIDPSIIRASTCLDTPKLYLKKGEINFFSFKDECSIKLNYIPVDLAMKILIMLKNY